LKNFIYYGIFTKYCDSNKKDRLRQLENFLSSPGSRCHSFLFELSAGIHNHLSAIVVNATNTIRSAAP
jgi:hypothetical protein